MNQNTLTRLLAVGLSLAFGSSLVAKPPVTSMADQPAAAESAKPPRRDPPVDEDLKYARSLSRAFNHAAEAIAPSVVHITQLREVTLRRGFFDAGETQLQPVGAGSGVVFTPDGYILTNNHVIEGAEKVTVKLSDGREFDGRVIGSDPATDLGVVKIGAENLKAAQWGDSEDLYVGEWVLAVGSPFGQFDNSVTAGIVSAKNRSGFSGQRDERFEDFIQTDAAINPGNSGGPLVNLEGKVVGINSQIATRNGGNVGIGLSIPSSIARPVMDMISKSGKVQRGWIGVAMSDGASEVGVKGALIQRVVAGGPAAKGGLRKNDVVTKFNGKEIDTSNRMRNAIAFTAPDADVDVEVVRDGQPVTLELKVLDTIRGRELLPGGKGVVKYGFTVETLPDSAANQLGTEAVIVNYLTQLGAASQSGLELNDIILRVNGTAVKSADQFDRVMRGANDEMLKVQIYRPRTGQQGTLRINPRE